MTLDDLQALKEEYSEVLIPEAGRLADRLSKNPVYTRDMLKKVDAARAELVQKLKNINAQIKALKDKQKEDPNKGGEQPDPNKGGEQPDPNNGGEQPDPNKGGEQPDPNKGGEQPDPNNGGEQPDPNKGGEQPDPNNGGEQPDPNNGGEQPVKDTITASVGAKGKNLLDDVRLVQELLNQRSGSRLGVDGKCGPKTIAQIQHVQRCIFQNWNVDGRVDPNGKTWKWLKGSGALPALPPKPVIPKPDPIKPVPNPVIPKPVEEKNHAAPEIIVNVLDYAMEKVLPYEKELFSMKYDSPKVKLGWGGYIRGGFSAEAKVSLKGARQGNSVSITGRLDAQATLSMTLGWSTGFNLYIIAAGASLEATVWGRLRVAASATGKLSAEKSNLVGTISASGSIYVSGGVTLTAEAGGHIFGLGGSVKRSGTWNFGKEVCIFSISLNPHSLSFDFNKKRFSAQGPTMWGLPMPSFSYSFTNDFEKASEQGAQEVGK